MRPSQTQPIFRALADPSRRDILLLLTKGDMTIAQVAENFDMTRAAVKKHLTVLEQGRLISVHSRGRERINHLEPKGLQTASQWINHFSRFWDARIDALQSAIQDEMDHKK